MTEKGFEVNRDQTVICEVSECNANATGKIAVKVGTLGVISISVCSDCAPIFQEPATTYKLEHQEAEQSLESQIKEKTVLEKVGTPESNTVQSKSTSIYEEQRS